MKMKIKEYILKMGHNTIDLPGRSKILQVVDWPTGVIISVLQNEEYTLVDRKFFVVSSDREFDLTNMRHIGSCSDPETNHYTHLFEVIAD